MLKRSISTHREGRTFHRSLSRQEKGQELQSPGGNPRGSSRPSFRLATLLSTPVPEAYACVGCGTPHRSCRMALRTETCILGDVMSSVAWVVSLLGKRLLRSARR